MPRNLDENIYLSVPIRKDSSLLAHLKDEAQRARGHKRIQMGPYVSSLLEERDHQLYGEGEGQALWFSSHPASLAQLIEVAVQKAIASILPSLPLLTTQVQSLSELVEESEEETIEQEAAALAASLKNGGWGCDD